MNTLNFREFIRFNYQSAIIPNFIAPDDATFIFRLVLRERTEEINGGLVENY